MKADDMAELLAPISPPCFSERSTWIAFVRAAASAHHKGDAPGPLRFDRGVIAVDTDADLRTADEQCADPLVLIDKGRRVRFNENFGFCAECTADFGASKRRQGKCKPQHLRDLFASKETP